MSKHHPWAAVGTLLGVFAIGTTVPRLSAQDTSSTSQTSRDTSAQILPANPDTSGYSGMAGDTTGPGYAQPVRPASPFRLGDSTGMVDTSAIVDTSRASQHRAQVWYAPKDSAGGRAADTTGAGHTKVHQRKRRWSRIHPADTASAAEPGAATTPNGARDTSGMGGRRAAPDSTSDSGHVSGP